MRVRERVVGRDEGCGMRVRVRVRNRVRVRVRGMLRDEG